MRYSILAIGLVAWVCVAHAGGGDRPADIARVASGLSGNLQVLSSEGGQPDGLRWAVWNVGSGNGQMVKLAVVSAKGKILSQVTRPDAYDATITAVPDWTWRSHPVFLLTLNYGAAAQTGELLGLGPAGTINVFDRRDAAIVELHRSTRGPTLLVTHQESGSEPADICTTWNAEARHLTRVSCAP